MNDSDDMDVDVSPMSSKSIKSGIERMLELGRELLQMSLRLEKKYQNVNDEFVAQNRKMMEVRGWIRLAVELLITVSIFRRHLVYWLTRIHGPAP